MDRDRLKLLKGAGIVALSILLISMFVVKGKKNDEIAKLEEKKASIIVPDKKIFQASVSHEKAEQLQRLFIKKFDDYQTGAIREGRFDFDNKGVRAIYNTMSITSSERITKTTPNHKVTRYYDAFDVTFDHFSVAKKGKDEYEVYAVPTIKHNGRVVNQHIPFMSLTFNDKDELIGGQLYESKE